MGYGGDGLVNRKRLGELKEEIGHDEFGEVIEIFVEECDSAAAQLAEGVGEEVGPVLHFLRGAAMNLGLDALAAACLEGERAAGRGESGRVDGPAIAALYDASRKALLETPSLRGAA